MDIVKCNTCGHVLISGNGCLAIFGKGTKLGCKKCGNTYTFGEEKPKEIMNEVMKEKKDFYKGQMR